MELGVLVGVIFVTSTVGGGGGAATSFLQPQKANAIKHSGTVNAQAVFFVVDDIGRLILMVSSG
jgi:hypothetical protein